VRIPTARTAGDTRISGELVLHLSDVGTLWRELHGVPCTSNLVNAELRLANR
jgi:hypothetical protein